MQYSGFFTLITIQKSDRGYLSTFSRKKTENWFPVRKVSLEGVLFGGDTTLNRVNNAPCIWRLDGKWVNIESKHKQKAETKINPWPSLSKIYKVDLETPSSKVTSKLCELRRKTGQKVKKSSINRTSILFQKVGPVVEIIISRENRK